MSIMKKLLLFLMLTFCLTTSVSASDWFLLTESDNGNKLYADIDSTQRTPDYATTWLKNVLPNKSSVLYKMTLSRVDRTYAITTIIVYDANGKVIAIDNPKHYNWKPIPPDSKLENMFQAFW